MVYNFNHGLGWASSGVEYAQSYRAKMLRRAGIPAKFVFTDYFKNDNIQMLSKNIGFEDDEVIWLYSFFTDVKTSPVTYTLDKLEKTFSSAQYEFSRNEKTCMYRFPNDTYYRVFMADSTSTLVQSVEIVSNNLLIRRDYYSYCKTVSEYYAPLDGKAHLYSRTFYNEDGSIAYEEVIDGDSVFYRFEDQVLYSKEELVGYMVKCLNLTEDDVIIIDRSTDIGQPILENRGKARVGSVVHADHFSEGNTDENNILWNNYYEYLFTRNNDIDFYITATDAQNKLMRAQFMKYQGWEPNVVTIPVGSLEDLKEVSQGRLKHSIITASRLATEKHCDWILEAVVKAHDKVPDISLDIYGKGGQEAELRGLISKYGCASYVRLMGQQNLENVYASYEAYVSASQSEGFGLTLMEAIGSGLPIIGFDVRYGNQTFIEDGLNGYRIPISDEMDKSEKVELLTKYIVKLFTEDDTVAMSEHSYKVAEQFSTEEVEKKWIQLLR